MTGTPRQHFTGFATGQGAVLDHLRVRQLGWWHSQYSIWKDKRCSKPPTRSIVEVYRGLPWLPDQLLRFTIGFTMICCGLPWLSQTMIAHLGLFFAVRRSSLLASRRQVAGTSQIFKHPKLRGVLSPGARNETFVSSRGNHGPIDYTYYTIGVMCVCMCVCVFWCFS